MRCLFYESTVCTLVIVGVMMIVNWPDHVIVMFVHLPNIKHSHFVELSPILPQWVPRLL